MKINISKQHIYLLSLSTLLLVFVLLFSFLVLIPAGKEYRAKKLDLKKYKIEKRKYVDFHEQTYNDLKDLQSKNRNIILAFDKRFDVVRFKKEYIKFFQTLDVFKKDKAKKQNEFSIYEVNATSHIKSPTKFYDFLEALNKSDWIIEVNFPIEFKRDGDLIRSSFTMKVYHIQKKKKDKHNKIKV